MTKDTLPLWKRVVLWLMYAEMPYAWVAYLTILTVVMLCAPWFWVQVVAGIAGALLIVFEVWRVTYGP